MLMRRSDTLIKELYKIKLWIKKTRTDTKRIIDHLGFKLRQGVHLAVCKSFEGGAFISIENFSAPLQMPFIARVSSRWENSCKLTMATYRLRNGGFGVHGKSPCAIEDRGIVLPIQLIAVLRFPYRNRTFPASLRNATNTNVEQCVTVPTSLLFLSSVTYTREISRDTYREFNLDEQLEMHTAFISPLSLLRKSK